MAVDYAAAGRALLDSVKSTPGRYDSCNVIYEHPSTHAKLYVGNASLAASRDGLRGHGITRIVFCQDRDGKCHFEGEPEFSYLKYPIGLHMRDPKSSSDPLAYFHCLNALV